MAVGGYKAGTIYLDVVATYEGIQDKARQAVRKAHEGIDKEAEKAGQKSGEAFAKAEAEELSKARQKLGQQQLSHHKGVNRSMVVDSEKAARQMQQTIGETTKAHERGAARIEKASRQNLEVQIEHLDTLIEETRQRAKRQADEWVAATDKGAREAIEVRQKETTDALREVERRKAGLVNVLKDEYAERDALLRDWVKAQDKHYADVQTLAIQIEKDITKAAEDEAADRIRLGEEMADAREAQAERRRQAELQEAHYREKRRAEELAAEKKFWDDYAVSAEHAERERKKRHLAMLEEAHEMDKVFNERRKQQQRLMLDEAYAMDRDFNRRKKDEHLAMLNEAHAMNRDFNKEQEKDLEDHLGVVGRMIRKGVTGGLGSIAKIKIDADSSPAEREIQDLRAKLVALRDVKVGVDMDISEFEREYGVVRTQLAFFARTHRGRLGLEATKALAEMKNVNREISEFKRKARVPTVLRIIVKRIDPRGPKGGLGDDGANAFRIFNPLVLLAVTALTMVGPAAAVAAAGIATVAGAAIAGAGAIGVMVLAFNGVFKAVQEQIKAEDDVAQSAQQSARQRATAARQVRDAQEGLADAEQDAARRSEDAARAVEDAQLNLADTRRRVADDVESALRQQEDAERRLEDAQRSAAQAQRDLTEARREARREIQDLSMSYRESQLAEKEAANSVLIAQERLNDVRRRQAKGDASAADVQAAAINVQQARLRAEEARVRRQRAGADSKRAQRRGVAGSDRVMSAQESVRSANQGVEDAQRNVADAAKATAKARTDGARQIAAAERGVTDALRNQARVAQDNARALRDARQAIADAQESATLAAEQQSAAARNAKQSMEDLSPAGREFAQFVLSLRSGFKEIRDIAQAGMLPGLTAGMKELGIYEAGFKRFVGDMSGMLGDLFASFGKQLTNDRWRSFFDTLGKDGPRQAGLLGQALFNVFETIAGITDAFSPLTTEMLTWLERATAGWSDWAAGLKGSPAFERFLGYVRRVAPEVKDFFVQLGRAMINLGIAIAPFGEGIMNALTGFFRWIADMDPKQLGTIVALLVSMFIAMQLGAGVMQLIITLMTPWKAGIALIVTALTLLALWTLNMYQTNEGFRKGVHRVLDALRPFGQWLSEHMGTIIKWASLLIGFAAAALVLWKVVSVVMAVRRTMQLLGLTMKLTFLLNPYVLAIAALVGVIIYLWKTNDSFRDAVKTAWEAIKRAMQAVADWWTSTAAPAMGAAFRWLGENVLPILKRGLELLGEAITWLWENVVLPYIGFMVKFWTVSFKAIAAISRWLWNNVLKPVFSELNRWIREVIAPALRWWWNNVTKPVFEAIGRGARTMWNKVIKPVFRALWGFIRNHLGPTLRWLWNNVAKPVFNALGRFIRWTVNNVIIPVMRGFRITLTRVVGPAIRWLYKNVVKPTFNAIGRFIRWTWNKLIKPVFTGIRWWVRDVIGPIFRWLWNRVIKPVWKGIYGTIRWAWTKIGNIFDKIKKGVKTVRNAFRDARDGIARIWSKMTDKIKDPLDKALGWIDRHFLSKIKDVLKAIGADDLAKKIPTLAGGGSKASGKRAPQSRSGGLQKYAGGGTIEGPYRGPKADNVLGISYAGVPTAWVNPREYVTNVASTAKMERRHPGVLDYINKHGDLPRLAKGGFTYPAMVKWIKDKVPGAIITSTKRNWGTGSYHDIGKAIDVGGSGALMKRVAQAIQSAWGSKITELIHNPGFSVKNGKRVSSGFWGGGTWGAHRDHVHWAMSSMSGKGGSLGGIFSGLAGQVAEKGASALKSILKKAPGGFWGKASASGMGMVADHVASLVDTEAQSFEGDPGSAPGGGGVDKWRGTVRKALWIMKQPASLVSTVLRRMNQESGGNARALNDWDSNAARGTPSKGLMQVIGPTFRAYRHPGYSSNIYDPLANILASMRYAIATYGSLSRAYNRRGGYARGTQSAEPGLRWVGEEGPELVNFRGGERVWSRDQSRRIEAAAGAASSINLAVYVQNPWGSGYLEAKVDQKIRDNDNFKDSLGRMG